VIELNINASISSTFRLQAELSLPNQGVTAIFGASGSGKTSLLRALAGLDHHADTFISVNGQVWQDEKTFLPTYQRPVGYVFQEASLFSHLTVQQNLDYAVRRAPSADQSMGQIVEILALTPLLGQYPHELSGGEAQRVGIARSILNAPALLLMDEPLASLDQAIKEEALSYLALLTEETQTPILYVSHALSEVVRIASRMVFLEDGRVSAKGELNDIVTLASPLLGTAADASVALPAKIARIDSEYHLAEAICQGHSVWLPAAGLKVDLKVGQAVRLRVMARDVSLSLDQEPANSILNRLPCTVIDIIETADPATRVVRLQFSEQVLMARITAKSINNLALDIGSDVWAQVKSVAVA
jgi:molybdate transport system ATP-binding protein